MQDPKTEAILDQYLVEYVYEPSLNMSEIDLEQSLQNQARIEQAIYPETVNQYAEAMEAGSEFPALVGYQKGSSIILIDGNHRAQAYDKLGVNEVDIYLVDAAPDLIQALTFVMNAQHGRPPTREERVHHGIHLRDLGRSLEEAAQMTGLTKSVMAKEWQMENARRRARKLGVNRGFDNLSSDVRSALQSLQSDTVFKALVTFLLNARKSLSLAEMKTLIRLVKEETTERTMLQKLEEFKQSKIAENRTSGRTRHHMDARRTLLPHLGFLAKADAVAVANACITEEQKDNLRRALVDSVQFCRELMTLITPADDDEDE